MANSLWTQMDTDDDIIDLCDGDEQIYILSELIDFNKDVFQLFGKDNGCKILILVGDFLLEASNMMIHDRLISNQFWYSVCCIAS